MEDLKEYGILCEDNMLDPMFKIALKSTTTVMALTSSNSSSDMGTKIREAVSQILLQLMQEEDDIEQYVETVYLLVLREGKDHSGLSQPIGKKGDMSPYG